MPTPVSERVQKRRNTMRAAGLRPVQIWVPEGPWSGKKDVEMATLNWVHWYNEKRLFGPLGYISPATAERSFYNTDYAGKIAAE
jgi:transposase InsO family protein